MTNTALNRTTLVQLTNESGGTRVKGDVVILDDVNATSFTTTTTSGYTDDLIGVVLDDEISNSVIGGVAFAGWVPQINLDTAATLGDFIKTATTEAEGTPVSTNETGVFAQTLETGSTPEAYLFGATTTSTSSLSSTSDLPEGSNLYYTDERVDDRVSNLLTAGSGISLSYDDGADSLEISSNGGGGGGGAGAFTELTDTPSSYSADNFEYVTVSGSELVFSRPGRVYNYLRNGSFNDTNDGFISGAPHFWEEIGSPTTLQKPAGTGQNPTTFLDPGFESAQSLGPIEIQGNADEGLRNLVRINVDDNTLTLTGYAKATSGSWRVTLSGQGVGPYFAGGGPVSISGSNTDWEQFTLRAKTVDGAGSTLYVYAVANESSSQVYFDEFMLTEGTEAHMFIPHPYDYGGQNTLYRDEDSSTTATIMGRDIVTGTFTEDGNPTTVNFGQGFLTAPQVVATVVGTPFDRAVVIESISTTQFVAQVYRMQDGGDRDEEVHFIAIGPGIVAT